MLKLIHLVVECFMLPFSGLMSFLRNQIVYNTRFLGYGSKQIKSTGYLLSAANGLLMYLQLKYAHYTTEFILGF